ncbi:MAG: hypothetical protein RLZZ252_1064 [Bacteroidota bacterium]|jgi:hypothetical protein
MEVLLQRFFADSLTSLTNIAVKQQPHNQSKKKIIATGCGKP